MLSQGHVEKRFVQIRGGNMHKRICYLIADAAVHSDKCCLKTCGKRADIKLFAQRLPRSGVHVNAVLSPFRPLLDKTVERLRLDRRESWPQVITLSDLKHGRVVRRVKEHALARRQILRKFRRHRVKRYTRRTFTESQWQVEQVGSLHGCETLGVRASRHELYGTQAGQRRAVLFGHLAHHTEFDS